MTALTTRVQSNEGGINSQSQQITSLQAQLMEAATMAAVVTALEARVDSNELGITSSSVASDTTLGNMIAGLYERHGSGRPCLSRSDR